MNSSIYRFTLGMNNAQSQISIPVLLGDTGREWHINLSDGVKLYTIADGCLAKLTIKRPTGTRLVEYCAIEDNNTIVYRFSQNENTAAIEGIHECDITLYGEGDVRITTARFTMVVSERVTSSYEMQLSDKDQDDIDNINNQERERINAETARKDAEQLRVDMEYSRQDEEESRKNAEIARQEAEKSRADAEIARENAEIARADAEINRNNVVAEAKNTADTALTTVQTYGKRITNLEQGIMPSPFYTDNSVAYTKNIPVDACPYAEVSKIGGMTYDDGSDPALKNAKVTEPKIVGANLFNDKAWFKAEGFKELTDGSWECRERYKTCWTNTSHRSGTIYINVTGKTAVTNGTVMYIEACYVGGGFESLRLVPSDDFKTYRIATEEDKTVDYVQFYYGVAGTYYLKGVSISFADTSEYIPYTETPFPIPTEVQALDGYGVGLDESLYNYIDFVNKEFVKSVGKVAMGDLNWTLDNANGFYYSSPLPETPAIKAKGKCIAFSIVSKDYHELTGGDIVIRDISYPYSEGIVLAEGYVPNDVWIYYELETPVITPISHLLSGDNFIKVEGGGTITAVNEYEYAVPTEITYMVKGSGNSVSAPIYNGEYEVIQ